MKNLLIIIALGLSITARAANIQISAAANSIHNAIHKAHSGDTITIEKGIYHEHDIIIDKKLCIIGKDFPVVDAENKYQAFIVKSDSTLIQGIQVQNIGNVSITDMAGIRIVDAKNVTIKGNRLINNTFGIYLQNAAQCSILNNLVYANKKDEMNGGNGIHAWHCNNLTVRGNNVCGHRDGIYFEFVTNTSITANNSHENARYGLHFMFSNNDTYSQNVFMNNGAGVAVMYSKQVFMQNNSFLHNWGDASYGLLLKEISDSRIEHNKFVKNTVGIHMETTTNVDVKQNLFQDNGWAIRVQASCSGSNFIRNNFIGNSFDVATNGSMVLNVFDHNYWDKYDGYDLNKNNIGDVPYYPVSVYSVVTEKIPTTMILYRSLLTDVMEQVEKVLPTLIPDKLRDDYPQMKKLRL